MPPNLITNRLDVVCAVIFNEKQEILACQRNQDSDLGAKWEFPGGKIEVGESQTQALQRELIEELNTSVSFSRKITTVYHSYERERDTLDIALHPYLCKINEGQSPECIIHKEIRWVSLVDANELDWAEADIPILNELNRPA